VQRMHELILGLKELLSEHLYAAAANAKPQGAKRELC